jgi:hypothetical protein
MSAPDATSLAARRLTRVSAALTIAAFATTLISAFWAASRGDWQAVVLWAYWFGAPLASSLSFAFPPQNKATKRTNAALLSLWLVVSLALLLLPFWR